jgi:RimJ/RimL family protein N-acetyltransferase
VRSLEDARAYITRILTAPEGYGLLVVERAADGERLGMCGLIHRPWLDAPDLAYAFLASASGQGLATEAGRAVMAYARGTLRLDRVMAIVVPANRASIRVLEKLGFVLERVVADPADGTELLLYAHAPSR